MTRHAWIDHRDAVAVVRQCARAGVSRATVSAQPQPRPVDATELRRSRLLDEADTRHPFYGSRTRGLALGAAGRRVNRKRVPCLMRQLGLAGMAPGPPTSRTHPEHKVSPDRLRGGGGGQAQAGLEHGYHVPPAGAWLRLAGGEHRLVRAPGAQLADQPPHGIGLLCRVLGGSRTHPRQTGNVHQRSRLAVHRRAETGRRGHQQGWTGGRVRPPLRRAALAQRHARGRVSNGLCRDGRIDDRPGAVRRLLQRRAAAPVAGSTDARRRVSNREGGR